MHTHILEVNNLSKLFPLKGGILGRTVAHVQAIRGVTLSIRPGETLGLVGESGCGKSTLGRTIIRLEDPTKGNIHFQGKDILSLNKKQMKGLRSNLQMIFQDPFSSLNPKMNVFQLLSEPIKLHERKKSPDQLKTDVLKIMADVGLPAEYMYRFPHEFSGGQRQRISIGRALAPHPQLIICDEPVSALDVSIQAQVINLLMDLQQKYNLAYLFISHDLTVVRHMSHRIAVMYLGKIVEMGENDDLYHNPKHPYTESLLASIPVAKVDRKQRTLLTGDVPSPINPPSGCAFHTRCPEVMPECKKIEPQLFTIKPGHIAACLKWQP